jgi:signal transduction histidine kinase
MSAPFLAFPLVGAVIVSKDPRNRLGWLMNIAGMSSLVANFVFEYAIAALNLHQPLPLGGLAAWLAYWVWAPSSTAVPLMLLLVPNGRFLSPRWRWVAVVAVVNLVAVAIVQMFSIDVSGQVSFDNPLGTRAMAPAATFLFSAEGPIVTALIIVSLGAFILRYRRADSEMRHQLKWLLYAFILIPLSFVLGAFPSSGSSPTILTVVRAVVQFISLTVLAASFAIAMLKYRLYDIDVVISRTLVYGALAAFITAVYVGIVVGVGTLVGSGGRPNLALSVFATALVAVGFQPLRERLQRAANRLVYGKRATPYEVLARFSENAAETYAADEVLPRMARVLGEGTAAQRADVWLRVEDQLRPTASWPADANGYRPLRVAGDLLPEVPETDRVVPVLHQGELLGALSVRKRQGESLTPIEEKLVDDLAHQAGLVLKNVGLTSELMQRLEELRASRQRLVKTQDEERRRLERNLHDGAQQNLVALNVKLGLADIMADRDPAKAKDLITQLKSDTAETLETLRDLARGIYPPLLADEGLRGALEAQARKATLPVSIEAAGLERYPQETEAAVYFCCLEALQNIQKYAGASRATIRLKGRDGGLNFEVEDDGQGFDPATTRKGSGLQNMEDRMGALHGDVTVSSRPGEGTRVMGRASAYSHSAQS